MTLESLEELRKTVKSAHEKGKGFSCCTINQIRIALEELQTRMEKDEN